MDTEEPKNNLRVLTPLPKSAPPKSRAPSKEAYSISTDKLIQLLIQKMDEMHNDIVALGHNDRVMEHYFDTLGEHVNLQTDAILRVNDKLADVMAWIKHTDPTTYREEGRDADS